MLHGGTGKGASKVWNSAMCSHLLWELAGIHKNHPEQKWAPGFIDLLLEMKKARDKAVCAGKEALSRYHLHKFDKRYDELILLAMEENPLPETTEKTCGRKKKEKSSPW